MSKNHILLSFAVLTLFCLLLLIVFGDKGLADLNMLKKHKQGLTEQNLDLRRENLALYRSIKRLKNDPEFIENVARQELGVIGENQIILKPAAGWDPTR